MERSPIYLDHNATAPLRPEAAEAVTHALHLLGNPSSVHRFGRLARRLVEDARESVARLVNACVADVVFTSGGTEANDLALNGTPTARVLVSAVEHVSVLAAAGDGAVRLPVDRDGVIDLGALEAALAASPSPALVSVMLANNETGVIQPVAEVAAIARASGALVHCDAVQAAGRIEVDFASLGVDMMTLSAHKLGGPLGVGVLVVAEKVVLEPRITGGGQERGRRAGTENVPGTAGFGAVAEAARTELAERARNPWPRVAALRDRLEGVIARRCSGVRIFGAAVTRLPNTSCFALPGLAAETQVMALDLAGIAVSAGAACSSGKVAASHVLDAMGADAAASAIRVSLGPGTGDDDISCFVEAWAALDAKREPSESAA